MEGTCFICNDDISIQESVVVRPRGMVTLKDASVEKNDGKYEILKDLTTIEVHKRCRQKYILKKRDVDKLFKQSDESIASTSLQLNPIKAKLRKSTINFKVKYRSNGLPEGYKRSKRTKPKRKKRIISYVKKPSFTNAVTNILPKGHDTSKRVCKKIASITADPLATYHKDCYASTIVKEEDNESSEDARYHLDCYASTIIVKEEDNESSEDENITKSMNIIYSYIESHDDCKFTLKEFKKLLVDDYIPDDKIIKSKLIERYGINIVWCT